MLRTRSAIGPVVVVLALAVMGAGCGGGDDSGSPFEPAAASDDSVAPDEAAPATASDDTAKASGVQSGGGGGSEAPQLAQGTWEGTLHFEITGDVEASEDLFGAAQTQGAFTVMTFSATDTGAGSQIGFTANSNEESAVFVTSEDFTGGGEIGEGKECSITMSQNDEAAAEGSFSCKGVKGVKVTSTEDLVVDIEGAFTLARP